MAFYGIDLGTTNSVISMAKVKSDGRVVATPVDVERKSGAGIGINGGVKYTSSREKTLPSCVYYDGNETIVGDYAREQYKKYPESVVKSVKSQMGQPRLTGAGEAVTDLTPEAVSARILSHLKKRTEIQNKCRIDNVIITIPASFDAAQREATMKAAEKAGFIVNGPDGSRKPILISEPNAVLYDISQKIMNGEISDTVLDLSTKKNVLVFDIGGGTLDVTFHELMQEDNDSERLGISEIATSRYTQLAGDDFDKAIAEELYKRCIAQLREHKQDIVESVEKSKPMVMKLLTTAAERLKIDMSMNCERDDGNSGWFEDDDFSSGSSDWFGDSSSDSDDEIPVEVSQSIGNDIIYSDTITKSEFEAMIESFMGNDYVFGDYFDYSPENDDTDNIIAPVLDVLQKAERYYYNKGEDFRVDAVILNGGMSKLYLIKERLERFFNLEPITTTDPDLSVANGAAIYACIYAQMTGAEAQEASDTRRKNLIEIKRKIQTDSLYVGLAGGACEKLISEGDELPFSTTISDLRVNPGSNTVEIPIKRGVRKGEMPVIARGVITFPRAPHENSRLNLQISVDASGLISIKASVVSVVGVSLGSAGVELALGESSTEKSRPDSVKIRPRVGAEVNAKNELHMLLQLYKGNGGKKKGGKGKSKSSKANAIVDTIMNCGNPADFEEQILKDLVSGYPEMYRAHILQIASAIGASWSDGGRHELERIAESIVRNEEISMNPAKQSMVASAKFILLSKEETSASGCVGEEAVNSN